MLLLLALVWGSSFILIKKALVVFSPGEVGAFRIVTAALVLLPLGIPKVKLLNRRQMAYLFCIGFLGSFIPAFLFATAQTQLSSSLAGVINALTPLMVMVIGALLFKTKISRQNAIGLVIALMGVCLLVLAGNSGKLDVFSGLNLYGLLIVLASICYGFNVNIIKFKIKEINPTMITAISLMMVLPIASLYLFGFTSFSFKLVHVEGAWLAAGYITFLGAVGTALALILFNSIVKLVTPVFASSVTYIIPLVAIFWGVLDGETLFPFHYLGIFAVVVGVWIGNRKAKAAE
ncbi:DMT family transporter [Cyclobacterium amurskyense]|mgnify:CR=1 FL=1|uniref:DMT family transporter n=1 Tax=Cyclobacterium amurskyense TaxID=320787 RepID=UPI0030DD263A|tara:strand:- start:5960 stop:6829 length:870 start_codon:yes stop_codon:yes gene_type:complete